MVQKLFCLSDLCGLRNFLIRMISEWQVARLNAQKHLLEELVLARTKELEQAYAEIEK